MDARADEVVRAYGVTQTKIRNTITEVLSTRLLDEILAELAKYDAWRENLFRNHIKSKKPNPINRDQLLLFLAAERTRLTEAAVHLQYVFTQRLLHPEQDIQTPFVTMRHGGPYQTEFEQRVHRELQTLTEWIIKRDELDERFKSFLAKSKSVTPVHKQDHDPVRRCTNVKCNNIALFKHSPDSLVCVSCGTKQTYLDNNIAYGEEVMWQSTHEHKKVSVENVSEPVTVSKLLATPYLLQQSPKAYDLSYMFHYDVESPPTLETCQKGMIDDMSEKLRTDPDCRRFRQQWQKKPSNIILLEAARVWKQYLKSRQFKHTPAFVWQGVFAVLGWVPPPIPKAMHEQLSQSLYLFCSALAEHQAQNPDHAIHKIKKANFRKFVLYQIVQTKQLASHILFFLPTMKQDKQHQLYELAFQLVCHYIEQNKANM